MAAGGDVTRRGPAAALDRAGPERGGRDLLVAHIDARQQWAFEVVLQARLNVMPELGALFIRGEVGSLMPYLPSGAYL